MFTKKQFKGIIFCGIGALSLLFALLSFILYSGVFGFMFILASLTYAAIGLLDLIPTEPQNRRAPQPPRPQAGYLPNQPMQNGYVQPNNDFNNQPR